MSPAWWRISRPCGVLPTGERSWRPSGGTCRRWPRKQPRSSGKQPVPGPRRRKLGAAVHVYLSLQWTPAAAFWTRQSLPALKALELLKSLTDLQAGADPGARDLYKRVTGQSSIDNSIAATRRTIEAYDRVLTQLEAGAEPPVVSVGGAGTQGSPNRGQAMNVEAQAAGAHDHRLGYYIARQQASSPPSGCCPAITARGAGRDGPFGLPA